MKFHFEFDIKKLHQPINHKHKMLLIGSCFTENIGAKLRKHKFNVLENSHGILFNPVSVAEAVGDCINNKTYSNNDLFCLNESWHSWKHHSRFSGMSVEESLKKINDSIAETHQYLKEADYLMITLGSSWTYTLTSKAANVQPGSVAANNHKAPSDWFEKKLLSAEETFSVLDAMVQNLQSPSERHGRAGFNPKISIIFTISPVRHLREGVIENNRSKAVLIQAVHQLIEKYERAYYFPAYELVIDDLRDYRFYAEDLVHPNYAATEYVWEKFTAACMNEETRELMKHIAEINLAVSHKPFNSQSSQHKKFLAGYLEKTMALEKVNAFLDMKEEKKYFEGALKGC